MNRDPRGSYWPALGISTEQLVRGPIRVRNHRKPDPMPKQAPHPDGTRMAMTILGLRTKQALWYHDDVLQPGRDATGRRKYDLDRVRAFAAERAEARARRRRPMTPIAARQRYSDQTYGVPPMTHPLRSSDVAEILGIGRSAVHRSKTLPYIIVRRARAYSTQDVERERRRRARRAARSTSRRRRANPVNSAGVGDHVDGDPSSEAA